jgi:transcriptional regulator with GAF, ATPase, and Fis domain
MHVNENDFFREVVKRICSHLDIERSMQSCTEYLQAFIPAVSMHLQLYEPNLGAMRTIAHAGLSGGTRLDILTPLPDKARADMEKWDPLNLPGVIIINQPERYPVSRAMSEHFGTQKSPTMLLALNIEGSTLGTLTITGPRGQTYNENHAKLFGMVREPFCIAMANTLKHREVLKLRDMLADDNRYLQHELMRRSGDLIIGDSTGLKQVVNLYNQVAVLDSPVLLLGETGTGKDVIANAIHYSSPRKEGPFITVNCGAIPESLVDSELFGHEKGAFTGAQNRKRGRFERADRGTIFLDEIGEMPLNAQVRMLRVFQNKEIERVGGAEVIPVDIRIIAATNRNLEEMVRVKSFREDLWFRLNVFPIRIPPLRERIEDIPALVSHFISRKSRELKLRSLPNVARGEIDRLMRYKWPGNVRELENVIERSLILHRDGPLMFDNINNAPRQYSSEPDYSGEEGPFELDRVVADHIRRVLKITKGKVHGRGGAAELLKINPSTLRNRMNRLGIPYTRSSRNDSNAE